MNMKVHVFGGILCSNKNFLPLFARVHNVNFIYLCLSSEKDMRQ